MKGFNPKIVKIKKCKICKKEMQLNAHRLSTKRCNDCKKIAKPSPELS